MEGILSIRKSIKGFFDRYDLYIIPCLKFLLAFFTFVMIGRMLSYWDILNNIIVLVILALLCAILPVNAIAVIGIILIILQCFAANLVVGLAALCFFVLLAVLVLRFVPSDMLWVILTPFAFLINIAAVIPVSLGILRNRASVAAGLGGVAVYCFLDDLPRIASQASLGRLSQLEAVQALIRSFISHEELILSCIVFTAVILIVNLIRRMLTKYTYLIAVIAGCAFYLILRAVGRLYLKTGGDLKKDLIGTLLTAAICLVIAFFVHCADYRRTRILQFEDDEYYYYVKAVPKRSPETPDDYDDEIDEELIEDPQEEPEEAGPEEEYPFDDEKVDPIYMKEEDEQIDPDLSEFDPFFDEEEDRP